RRRREVAGGGLAGHVGAAAPVNRGPCATFVGAAAEVRRVAGAARLIELDHERVEAPAAVAGLEGTGCGWEVDRVRVSGAVELVARIECDPRDTKLLPAAAHGGRV